MNTINPLCSLLVGECATVLSVSESHIKKRLSDVGLVPGTQVRCVGKSPLGDMKSYFIRGAVIAIRNCDSNNIEIEKGVAENGAYQ